MKQSRSDVQNDFDDPKSPKQGFRSRRRVLQAMLGVSLGQSFPFSSGWAATDAELPSAFARMRVTNAVYKLSQNTILDQGVHLGPAMSALTSDALSDYGWYGSVYCPEVGRFGRWIGGLGGHGFAPNKRNGYNCDRGAIDVWHESIYETADANGAEIYLDKKLADSLPEYRRFNCESGGVLHARIKGSRIVQTLANDRLEICQANGWAGETLEYGWGYDLPGRNPEGVSVFFFGPHVPAPLRQGVRYHARNWRTEANSNLSCQIYTTRTGGSPIKILDSVNIPRANGGYWSANPCYMRGWDEQFPVSPYSAEGWIIPRQVTSEYGMMQKDVPVAQFRYSHQVFVPAAESGVGEPLTLGINPWGGWQQSGCELGPLGGAILGDAKWPSGRAKRVFYYQRLGTKTWGRLRTNHGADLLYVPDGAPGEIQGGGGGTAAWMPGTRKGYGTNAGGWGAGTLLEVNLSGGVNNASARLLTVSNGPVLLEQGMRAINSPALGQLLVGIAADSAGLLVCDLGEPALRWRQINFPFTPMSHTCLVWASNLGPTGSLIVVGLGQAAPLLKVVTLPNNWRSQDGKPMPPEWVRDVPVTLQDGLTDVSWPSGSGSPYGSIDWIPKARVLSWLGSHHANKRPQLGQLGIRVA